MVAVELAAALGLTDTDPVGRPVARAGEAALVDEGLHERRGIAVTLPPVSGEGSGDSGEDRRGEVSHVSVGQDEEAGVSDDELQPGLAGLCVPADVGVPRGTLPGRRAERQPCEEPDIGFDQSYNQNLWMLDLSPGVAYLPSRAIRRRPARERRRGRNADVDSSCR